MIRLSFFLSLSFLVSLPILARTDVEWINTEINFGKIEETGGIQQGVFKFVNKGEKAVEIKEVWASCGCTDTDFTKGKISRGDTAYIKVRFDPLDRSGDFYKGVYVYINESKIPEKLFIKGTINPSPETLSLMYPFEVGNLHFESLEVDFGEIRKGNKRRKFIEIYNSGDTTLSPELCLDTDVLSYSLEPTEITPGGKAILVIYFDSSRLPWLGNKSIPLKLKWENEQAEITAKAKVIPDIP